MPLEYPVGLRLGAVRVSAALMHHLIVAGRPGEWVRIEKGLPPDAEYTRSYYDNLENCFVFVYQHPNFPLTPPGCRVQPLAAPQFSTIHLTAPLDAKQVAMLNEMVVRQTADAVAAAHVVGG